MNKIVSYFKNLTDVSSNKSLEDILNQIKSGEFKSEVTKIRRLVERDDQEKAADLKKALPAFTIAGTFKSKRSNKNIDHYSSLIILDYDKLNQEQIDFLSNEFLKIDFIYSFFISPSGKGIKVIVPVDTDLIHHEKSFMQVVQVFNELFEIPIDTSGKDISRLCFMSYDPDLYLNPQAKSFQVQLEDRIDYDAAFFQAIQITQRKYSYENGNRNNFIHFLACNSNRLGIPEDFAQTLILSSYDLSEDEVTRILKAVYTNNSEEHGTKKHKRNLVDVVEEILTKRYKFRYNEITTRIELKDSQILNSDFESLTDYKENSILRWLLKKGIKINQTLLRSIIRSDFTHPYNAFKDYFYNLPEYDGETDYIKEFADRVKTHDDELWQLVLKKWIVGLVACATTEKTNHLVLVFAGKQGIGKTTWILSTIPPQLQIYVYSGNINPNNKDTLIQLTECILINMDELETLNKAEIGSLKEIITKDAIRIRKAYGVNHENMPRRASFSGSVNSLQFLNDTTGSRRFLCFEIFEIDYKSPVNYEGIYSQAIYLLKSGYQYWLDQVEIDQISRNNDQFQIASQEEELLMKFFEPRAFSECKLFLTNSEIILKISQLSGMSSNSIRPKSLGSALIKNGFIRLKKGGRQVYAVYEKELWEIDSQTKEF